MKSLETRRAARRALCAAAALLAAALGSPGSALPAAGAPAASTEPPQLAAAAWYLSGKDGEVLAARDPTERRAVASITKLMTAVVTLEHAELSDLVTVGGRSSSVGESTANLRTGEQLPVSTLLRALLVASANDAAEALAVHVGRGSVDRFVALMNEKARQLGLEHTTYENPHGLDQAGHLSTAEDVTRLLRYALGIPFIRNALGQEQVVLPGGRDFPTTDDLLGSWAPLLGGKTGHTGDAGWSEVAAASGRGATVYGAVLGTSSRTARNAELQELLSYGLSRYHRVAAVDASRVYAQPETGYDRPAVELVAPRNVVVTVLGGTPLVERIVAPSVVALPVESGQRLGRVEVYEGPRLVARSPLVAAEAVSEPGPLEKSFWYAKRTGANLWGMVS